MKRIKVLADFQSEFSGSVTYEDGTETVAAPLQGNEQQLDSEVVEIVRYDNGRQFVFKSRVVEAGGKRFLARIPNPVYILLNSAVDNLNRGVAFSGSFAEHSVKMTNDVIRLVPEKEGTSDVLNRYLECKITAVNSLINALEIFVNQMVPGDYIYTTTLSGKTKRLNKSKIEDSLPFREKLEKLIPEIYPDSGIREQTISAIFEAYAIRKETVHMKTQGTTVFDQYYAVMAKLLDADVERYIQSAIAYMNAVEEDFIRTEN